MTRILAPLALGLTFAATPGTADAGVRKGDQDRAYEARQKSNLMALHQIESMVVPRLREEGATYLRGSAMLEPDRPVYRMRFQQQTKVFVIEIDARNGREIGRTGR
ncbi:hypothetical protein [Sphingobium boeckii]|uniref:Putative membrane protein YkoI n=1 Tax=Sphingobium boeckii TaxID=1082345 RepID=A0A7W9AEY9_9SPHN|nr:hypothetical protein [Sphingobium boeckii]MBB5684442.1 putative membrane protein YkoI [Sphingobium boeckii]